MPELFAWAGQHGFLIASLALAAVLTVILAASFILILLLRHAASRYFVNMLQRKLEDGTITKTQFYDLKNYILENHIFSLGGRHGKKKMRDMREDIHAV